ncbi:MAG: DEAD/DEAH box helicase [Oscillospiraceae bacterium]|jgi:ATP-dependent Lhr-like helicase|nr:DEAD/DEAH box helicase [Oscillospiraceae bacterium]
MTARDPFSRLAPAVQEFILRSGWPSLRAVQSAAIGAILDTDDNLLLATGTASGKTEAAFMPVVTSLLNKPARSVGALYISPLKALINDQFERIGSLLSETNIPITKWHGDAPQSRKRQLAERPRGILQITPESLEGLLDRDGSSDREGGCARMFSDLRFVIIDEVHAFMSGSRGIQTLCLLERIARIIGYAPRRIGLSATLGDTIPAERWLNMGTNRRCVTPRAPDAPKRVRLAMFEYDNVEPGADEDTPIYGRGVGIRSSQFYEDLYRFTLGRKAIIFARSRAGVEETTLNLRRIAQSRGTPDIYRAHHGSVSASVRESAEREMKTCEGGLVVAATVTLELGIDIGELDMVVQLDAPSSVSAFVQRLGRCGRKGQRAELMFFLTGTLDYIAFGEAGSRGGNGICGFDWSLLRSIATVQLYTTEKWIEPPDLPQAPYPLLYHQTMALLLGLGACEPSRLARAALTLAPFAGITREAYRTLLRRLIDVNHIAVTEEGLLILGASAERIVSTYRFCAVFETRDEYDVRYRDQSIGSISGAPPPGSRIVLAGKVWECARVLENSKTVFVEAASGSGEAAWRNPARVPVHDRVAAAMREVLASDTVYPYLDEAAADRLTAMRLDARRTGMLRSEPIRLTGKYYILCPWAGLRRLSTWALALEAEGVTAVIAPDGFDPVYLVLEYSGGYEGLLEIVRRVRNNPVDLDALPLNETHVIPAKYSEFIPLELLHDQYKRDALCTQLG